MTLTDQISNKIIDTIVNDMSASEFSTLTLISVLEKNHIQLVNNLQIESPRNWRAVVGKAIKRYSMETKKIQQITPQDVSPARWHKGI